MTSKYSVTRTELRTLQNTCKDNEEFLNKLADMIGRLEEKYIAAHEQANTAEHKVRVWENGEKND